MLTYYPTCFFLVTSIHRIFHITSGHRISIMELPSFFSFLIDWPVIISWKSDHPYIYYLLQIKKAVAAYASGAEYNPII